MLTGVVSQRRKGEVALSQNRPNFGPGGRGPGGFNRMAVVVKPKNLTGTVRRLWGYFGKERKLLSFIFILIMASTVIGLSVPYLIGKAIDSMSKGKLYVNFEFLEGIILVLLIAYTLDYIISVTQGFFMAGVSQRIVKNLRGVMFEKLQSLPIAFFDRRAHGDIMSRLTNDIDNVSTTISQSTTQLMSNCIMITGSFVMMLMLSPLLTLASVITIPMVFILTRTIAKRTKVLFKKQQNILGKLNGHIEENISGIQVVKAFNHQEAVIKEFDEINSQLREVGIKAQVWTGFIMPLMNVINNIGFAMVAGVGGALAVKGLITIGVIASFLSYSRQFARPLNEVAGIFNTLQSAIAGAERVFEILDEQEEVEDAEGAVELINPKGHVIFENVSFGYNKEKMVLRNISFKAEPGSSIALVGPTGAGKTTIVNLLNRFYDVAEGRILLDGKDIRKYTRESLRKSFGIVLQDTYLFSGTIKENIRFGKTEADDEAVVKAAKMANAHQFITRLSKGYNTVLAESGSNLSQGQRQLIAIARAILSNSSILILDEATSSVDTRTELKIQEAMIKLMEGRTSFIIAHRLSTIKDADVIMVIDNGEIMEKGNHESLMKSNGIYHNMYYSQFKNLDEENS